MKIKKLCYALSALPLFAAAHPALASTAEIEALKRQIAALEKRIAVIDTTAQEAKAQSQSASFSDRITLSGTVEIEGSASDTTIEDSGDWVDDSNSDIVVATVELGIAAQITDTIDTEIVLLHEEDDTDLEVDVAVINFAEVGGTAANISLGQMYVPFGSFETNLVNDTLVLELAETRETAALVGWENNGLSLAAYAFNGDNDNDNDVTENFGLRIAYETDRFAVGADYISNVLDSDGISDAITNDGNKEYGAIAVHGRVTLGPVDLIAEYLDVESLDAGDLSGLTADLDPEAFQLEAATTVGAFTVALAYQETDDALALGLPEKRTSLGASTDLDENVSLALEYWHDEDYSVSEGGSGEDSDNLVAQVGVSF